MSKQQRLEEFFHRLAAAAPVSTGQDMYNLLVQSLNAVEDELSGIPYNPAQWQSDSRMYPPQPDSRRPVPQRPHIVRYRTRAHNVFIASNGSIEIRPADQDRVLFRKPGSDGRGVWDQ